MYQASYHWYKPTKTLLGIMLCITICDVNSFHKLASYTSVDLTPDGCHTRKAPYSLQTLLKVLGMPARFTYWGHTPV